MSTPDLKIAPVIDLPVVTSLSLNPDRVLNSAVGKLQEVVIIGHTEDGEFYFASSEGGGGDVLWLMEVAKKKLLDMID